VSPMVVNFTPAGSGSTQTFLLENTGVEKIAIQIEAYHRFMDLDGKETRTPTDEFSVYPAQLALQAGEKKNVRVTWTGSQQPDRELSYRLVVSELPVENGKTAQHHNGTAAHGNLTFLMQYVASLYISPPNISPKVSVESFKILSDARAELTLKNSGMAHQVLKGMRLFFKTADGAKVELKNQEIEELQSENLLPTSSRRVYLTLPSSLLRAEKAKPGSVQPEIEM
jgi:fimbrial chaperone protein